MYEDSFVDVASELSRERQNVFFCVCVGVVVSYAGHADMYDRFLSAGMQIAGGVPLMCGGITDSQSDEFRTFRLGLFGVSLG